MAKLLNTAKRGEFQLALVIVIFLILSAGIFWANYRIAETYPIGKDFLVHWVAARSFIFEGDSPYSDATTQKIQELVFTSPSYGNENDLRFLSPFYSLVIYAPFSFIEDYKTASALWMTSLVICIFVTAFYSITLCGWQQSLWFLPLFFLFSLFWYPGLRTLYEGSDVILVGLLMVLGLLAIKKGSDITAGVLIALTTIQPLLVILFIFVVLIWAISKRRRILVWWLIGGIFALILSGMVFLPDWLLQNIWGILKLQDYNLGLTIGPDLEIWWPGIGTQLKWGISILLTLSVLIEIILMRKQGFTNLLWTICLSLNFSQWIGINNDTGNFILLLLPIVLIFSVIKERWNNKGDWINLTILLLFLVGLWGIILITNEIGGQFHQPPVMLILLPLITLVGLYWIRWWINISIRDIL